MQGDSPRTRPASLWRCGRLADHRLHLRQAGDQTRKACWVLVEGVHRACLVLAPHDAQPADLHEQVTTRAAADRRSLNSEILHRLEVALAAPRADAGSPGGEPASPAPLRGKPDAPA
ncbi:Arc family DNA-binding protein [Streptomyces sp. NPDC097610]|uniref:Arc family DNA-binding protein n=1 Tax=Streptomyces sp. NPDC097610 TaxID=3157227 RepID=UPI0033233C1C